MRASSVSKVEWRDLVTMRPLDGLAECAHPLPWLLSSWWFAAEEIWVGAISCSFLFFLTALRLNHEAIHNNLGFSPIQHRLLLHALSVLMLGSNNAVAANHLRHHAHIGKADDVVGKCGRMSGFGVLAYGPIFPVEMHISAWMLGPDKLKRRMLIDLSLNLVMITLGLASGIGFLIYHLIVMVIAQCLTAFFAVWITHHHTEDEELVARTQRSKLVNFLTYNMFFHLEHHLYPKVPVRRLPRLAARIDLIDPSFSRKAKRVLGG